jgi:hypothetical protein
MKIKGLKKAIAVTSIVFSVGIGGVSYAKPYFVCKQVLQFSKLTVEARNKGIPQQVVIDEICKHPNLGPNTLESMIKLIKMIYANPGFSIDENFSDDFMQRCIADDFDN